MINKAFEEDTNDRLYQRWIPFSNEIGFDDFKNSLVRKVKMKNDTRTAEEILMAVKTKMEEVERGSFGTF